jgi:hypothetical protein
MVTSSSMNESIKVGVVQTSLDAGAAWVAPPPGDWKSAVKISTVEELRARREIRHYLSALQNGGNSPDIVLLPELSVPIGYEKTLIRTAESMRSIIIAGMDYGIHSETPSKLVKNEAIVILPTEVAGKKISSRPIVKRVGKTYAAPAEEAKLKDLGVSIAPSPSVWLFNNDALGSFGVAVCYDFLDLDRITLYRGKIQHLFILAYNKDVSSFDHVAEAIARMVFCNVVVCNCGFFGGSVAVSPYREPFKRTIFRHSGMHLSNAQTFDLPASSLLDRQKGIVGDKNPWKNLPPGFQHTETISPKSHSI